MWRRKASDLAVSVGKSDATLAVSLLAFLQQNPDLMNGLLSGLGPYAPLVMILLNLFLKNAPPTPSPIPTTSDKPKVDFT